MLTDLKWYGFMLMKTGKTYTTMNRF